MMSDPTTAITYDARCSAMISERWVITVTGNVAGREEEIVKAYIDGVALPDGVEVVDEDCVIPCFDADSEGDRTFDGLYGPGGHLLGPQS
jgi:hypothetical protein